MKDSFKVMLNISLPILKPSFREEAYYSQLVELAREGLAAVV